VTSALFTSHFEQVVRNAIVADVFEFDGRCGDYDHFFETTPKQCDIVWREGEYRMGSARDNDEYAFVLFHGETPVGFYTQMMAWIDPPHRGKGLAQRMIVEFASHFGPDAFKAVDDPAEGYGFSDAGLSVHLRARELARQAPDAAAGP